MDTTICAISTAVSNGAISIIRLSGPESISIANSIFSGPDLTKVNSHTIHYGFIKEEGIKIDEVLVTVMKAPKTFTTEDVVEINCHGGIATTNKVLEMLLIGGAKLAEPGEFTKRAFLNGRINLLEAEAISDIINSETEKSRKLAINQMDGKLTEKIREIRKKIIAAQANIEVNIDYPEYEDIEQVTKENLDPVLREIHNDLHALINESSTGKMIKTGLDVAILGEPNVGKSSVLNRLIGEKKAIVTNIAGTTRDIIEGKLNLNGIILNLHDTAGIRSTRDFVEKIGVERSLETSKKADLVIYVIDNQIGITEETEHQLRRLKIQKVIILINKSDKQTNVSHERLKEFGFPVVTGTTRRKAGLDELKEKIIEMFEINELENSDFTYLSSARQVALASAARTAVSDALIAIALNLGLDLISIDLNECYRYLGEMIGEEYKADLLNELFSRFCLGK